MCVCVCYKIKRAVLTWPAFSQSNKQTNEPGKKRNLKAISGQAIECANFNLLPLLTAEITANDSQIMNDANHKHTHARTHEYQQKSGKQVITSDNPVFTVFLRASHDQFY